MEKFILPNKGLSAGKHHFEFDVTSRFFQAVEGSMVTAGNARVEVDAEKGAGGLSLDFTITGEVEVECDRCLEPLALPVDYQGRLVVRVGEPERHEEYDGETLWITPDEDIDLGQYIYESICLSLPLSRVHGEDAEGRSLCNPEMLARFQLVSQSEFDRIAEQKEQQAQSPMQEQLEEIKKNLK